MKFIGNVILKKHGHKCKLLESADPILEAIPGDGGVKRLKRIIFRLTTISEHHPLVNEHLYDQNKVNEEIRYQIKNHPFVVHPFSIFSFIWDILMMYSLSYAALRGFRSSIVLNFLPPAIFKKAVSGAKFNLRSLANLLCAVFWTRRAFWDSKEKKVEMRGRKILANYFVTYFPSDGWINCSLVYLKCVVRLEYHLNYALIYGLGYFLCYFRLFYVVKSCFNVLKLIRLPRLYCQIIELVIYAFFFIFVLCHISFLMVRILGPDETNYIEWWLPNLENNAEISKEVISNLLLYLSRSFAGATANTYHLKARMYYLEVFFWILCKLFTIYIVVAFMLIAKNTNFGSTKNSVLRAELEMFMRSKAIPPILRHRLDVYYTFRYQRSFFRESYILSILQGELQKDMLVDRCEKLVTNAPFFKEIPLPFLTKIMAILEEEIYLTNDLIVKQNSESNCMYFILSGEVSIITPRGTEVVHLKQGDFFGEVGLFYNVTRTASVIATEISVLYRLNKTDFLKSFAAFPDLIVRIRAKAKNRFELISILKEREEMI